MSKPYYENYTHNSGINGFWSLRDDDGNEIFSCHDDQIDENEDVFMQLVHMHEAQG